VKSPANFCKIPIKIPSKILNKILNGTLSGILKRQIKILLARLFLWLAISLFYSHVYMTVHGYSIYNRTKTYLILEVLSTCSLCNGDLSERQSNA